jgi:hypothetical protein
MPARVPSATGGKSSAQCGMSALGRYCCKSLFALLIKNSPGCRRDFRVKMWGTSSPDDKLTGDLGSVIETAQSGGRRLVRVMAGKSSPGKFWTFTTVSAISGHMHCSKQHNAPLAIRRHDRGCISGLLCGVFREQACRVPFLQIRRNRLPLRVGRETCQSPHSLCALARAAWMARFASVSLIDMSFA